MREFQIQGKHNRRHSEFGLSLPCKAGFVENDIANTERAGKGEWQNQGKEESGMGGVGVGLGKGGVWFLIPAESRDGFRLFCSAPYLHLTLTRNRNRGRLGAAGEKLVVGSLRNR